MPPLQTLAGAFFLTGHTGFPVDLMSMCPLSHLVLRHALNRQLVGLGNTSVDTKVCRVHHLPHHALHACK